MLRTATTALLAFSATLMGATATDMVTCARPLTSLAPGDVCYGVNKGLADAGFIAEAYQEPFTNQLRIVPPASAAQEPPYNYETTWTFASDGGDYEFCFGFCLASKFKEAGAAELYERVSAEGASDEDKLEFARTCITDSTLIFDDSVENPVIHKNITVPVDDEVGAEVIFFLIPDERAGAFLADPDAFWADSNRRRPLFSVNGANPGDLSQLVLFHNHTDEFTGDCPCDDTARTAFMWEDKTRSDRHDPDNSDSDFGDLVFIFQGLVSGTNDDFFCDPADPSTSCKAATKSSKGVRVTLKFGPTGVPCE